MNLLSEEDLDEKDIRLIDWQDRVGEQIQAEQGDGTSHQECDPTVWHPSQLAMLPECPRQALVRKLNLEETDNPGVFHAGRRWHRWMEENVQAPVFKEYPVEMDLVPDEDVHAPVIRIRGRCDAYDPRNQVVYDHKTTGSTGNYGNTWNGTRYPEDFFTDHERHVDYRDQLHVYMACLDAKAGQLVYSHKLDETIVPYPLQGAIGFDAERFKEIIRMARQVTRVLQREYTDEDGQVNRAQVLEAVKDGRWEKCSRDKCWNCVSYETLKAEIEQRVTVEA